MSTRSQIGFYRTGKSNLEKPEVILYRHNDGYPEGVLPDILPFLVWFEKARGLSDTEYAGARLLQYLCNKADAYTKDVYRRLGGDYRDELNPNFTGTLGHGICKSFHCDIEYYYAIYPDRVDVWSISFKDWDHPGRIIDEGKKILTVKYADINGVSITEKWVEKLLRI